MALANHNAPSHETQGIPDDTVLLREAIHNFVTHAAHAAPIELTTPIGSLVSNLARRWPLKPGPEAALYSLWNKIAFSINAQAAAQGLDFKPQTLIQLRLGNEPAPSVTNNYFLLGTDGQNYHIPLELHAVMRGVWVQYNCIGSSSAGTEEIYKQEIATALAQAPNKVESLQQWNKRISHITHNLQAAAMANMESQTALMGVLNSLASNSAILGQALADHRSVQQKNGQDISPSLTGIATLAVNTQQLLASIPNVFVPATSGLSASGLTNIHLSQLRSELQKFDSIMHTDSMPLPAVQMAVQPVSANNYNAAPVPVVSIITTTAETIAPQSSTPTPQPAPPAIPQTETKTETKQDVQTLPFRQDTVAQPVIRKTEIQQVITASPPLVPQTEQQPVNQVAASPTPQHVVAPSQPSTPSTPTSPPIIDVKPERTPEPPREQQERKNDVPVNPKINDDHRDNRIPEIQRQPDLKHREDKSHIDTIDRSDKIYTNKQAPKEELFKPRQTESAPEKIDAANLRGVQPVFLEDETQKPTSETAFISKSNPVPVHPEPKIEQSFKDAKVHVHGPGCGCNRPATVDHSRAATFDAL